jgi:hypothetical protein
MKPAMKIPPNHRERVAVFARASTSKQAIEGRTLSTQADELLALVDSEGWELAKLETFVESGRKNDRKVFDDFIDYCIDNINKIDILLVKGIDRFCRQGSEEYLKLKAKLKKAGVRLHDAEGIIQGEKNTLEDLGFEYDWSKYEPSRANEIARAEQAKDEVRISLTRMISHEIKYTQLGYWNRNSVYGFHNQKADTDNDGRRNILVAFEEEAFFIRKLFELKGERKYSDQYAVDELNNLGFKTRVMMRRDKDTKKPIGRIGGKPLTVKQMQRLLQRTVYAGVIMEKWTHDQPVLARFDGLVSIELFNKANEGKVYIEQNGSELAVRRNYSPWAVKKNRRNPMYPYKNVVLCPDCGKSLLGSASTGRSGQKFPAYHCARGHQRFSQKPDVLNNLVEKTISELQFTEENGRLFKECFLLVYEERRTTAVTESVKYSENLDALKLQQLEAYRTVKTTTSALVRARAETEYEELDSKITELSNITAKVEEKEMKARSAYKQAAHLMEHLEEVLIDKENVANQEVLFKLAFKELPSYSDLENGTVKLNSLFRLKQIASSSEVTSREQMVTPRGIEPRFPG